jgi:hypothetical protein
MDTKGVRNEDQKVVTAVQGLVKKAIRTVGKPTSHIDAAWKIRKARMRRTWQSRLQLGATIFLMGLGNSIGCATQGDLATVQQEVRNGLSAVRGQEQKIAELRRELKGLEQGKLKDLHETEMRLTDTLRDVQQQLEMVTLSQARMKEALQQVETSVPTKERMEGMYREKARLEGILHAMHVTLVEGLRTEKAELTDRLQVLDKALKDLQQSGDNIQPPARHVPEEQGRR